jgi:histidyl-tRNA synthetase
MALRAHFEVVLHTAPTYNLSQALAYAAKQNIAHVVLIGAEERAANVLSLRDMRRAVQLRLSLDDAIAYIQAYIQGRAGHA